MLFYSAFFKLSIGFERVLKLVLILDHMARNQLAPPDSKAAENYGHKLRALFDTAQISRTIIDRLGYIRPSKSY